MARYDEPHRRYHTVEHLTEVLAAFDDLAHLAADPIAVELALWFHDAIYDPTVAGNEAASAVLAAAVLGAGGDNRVAEVCRLVELTAGHDVEPDDANGAVVADADLSILGSAPDRYARYAADVRAEYAHVDDAGWRTGRAALLETFLARPRLYVTDRAHDRWDAPARHNLAAELATLR